MAGPLAGFIPAVSRKVAASSTVEAPHGSRLKVLVKVPARQPLPQLFPGATDHVGMNHTSGQSVGKDEHQGLTHPGPLPSRDLAYLDEMRTLCTIAYWVLYKMSFTYKIDSRTLFPPNTRSYASP